SWKAGLVADLVERTARRLRGGTAEASPAQAFPSAAQLALMAEGRQVIDGRGDELTVVTADRPGVFATVAGVLALHGLAVLDAAAHSSEEGRALARFRVQPRHASRASHAGPASYGSDGDGSDGGDI